VQSRLVGTYKFSDWSQGNVKIKLSMISGKFKVMPLSGDDKVAIRLLHPLETFKGEIYRVVMLVVLCDVCFCIGFCALSFISDSSYEKPLYVHFIFINLKMYIVVRAFSSNEIQCAKKSDFQLNTFLLFILK